MKTTTQLTSIICIGLIFFGSCKRSETILPEIKPSDGSRLTLNGGVGESDAENAVYVDFSTGSQQSVKRKDWSLGFSTGAEFRVILNNQVGMAGMQTNQTDLKAVNSTNFDISQLASDFKPEKLKIYDDTAGRLQQNVIAAISNNEAENKVYVVNTVFGESKKEQLWKIRVLRSGTNAYTLQYAKLDDTNISTLSINKDNAYNFMFISFEKGPVQVEPKKNDWDIVWSKSIFYTAMGPNTYIPYAFSDLVFINYLNGVTADQVVFLDKEGKSTGKPTYEEFDATKLSQVNLKNSRNVIGSNWRNTTGSGTLKDRYYVIKDVSGHIYKLKFIAMGAGGDGGKRGYPELEFKLVKSK